MDIERIDYSTLPPHVQGEVKRYIAQKMEPGHFLKTVICNDLKGAIAHADSQTLVYTPDIVRWFYNKAPSACWGSPDKMRDWLK
jgi:hypothetical protein